MDARKLDSRGESAARLARNIACVKYTLFCFNIVAWVRNGLLVQFNAFLLEIILKGGFIIVLFDQFFIRKCT
jgi:hypothetical protein